MYPTMSLIILVHIIILYKYNVFEYDRSISMGMLLIQYKGCYWF
jgi:hypothetical protein